MIFWMIYQSYLSIRDVVDPCQTCESSASFLKISTSSPVTDLLGQGDLVASPTVEDIPTCRDSRHQADRNSFDRLDRQLSLHKMRELFSCALSRGHGLILEESDGLHEGYDWLLGLTTMAHIPLNVLSSVEADWATGNSWLAYSG